MRHRSRFDATALAILWGLLLSPTLRADGPPAQRPDEGPAPAGTDLLDPVQLRGLWERQASEITAGRFEVVLFRYYDESVTLLDRAEAIRRLESLDPAVDEEAIEPLFDDIEQLGWPKQGSRLWGTKVEVAINGEKVANISHFPKGTQAHVYDGADEILTMDTQTSISSGRSALAQIDLAAIRTIPTWISRDHDVAVDPLGDREGILRSAHAVVRFDRETGFVTRVTDMRDGLAGREIIQIGPEEDRVGILPSVRAEIRCEGEKVKLLSIYLIKEADIDAEIEEKDFLVSVPAGTKVVDFRNKVGDRPTVVTVPIDLEDVKNYRMVER